MAPRSVKAIVMPSPGKLEVREFPYPSINENSAIIKVELSGICGTDKHMYKGEVIHPREAPTRFPIIPGHEVVGEIVEIGERASKIMEINAEPLKPGDRVVLVCDIRCENCHSCRNIYGFPVCEKNVGVSYGHGISCKDPPHLFGGWAEYVYVIPEARLAKVPNGVPVEAAVLTELLAVPYSAFGRVMNLWVYGNGYGPGDNVVVQGVGPLGLLNIIMARLTGAGDIIALDYVDYRLKMAEEFGADYTINMAEIKSSEERIKEVKYLTGGRGAELVIECTGVPDAVPEGIEMVSQFGTYLIEGLYIDMGDVKINPQRLIMSKNATIIAVNGQTYQSYGKCLKLMKKYNNKVRFDKVVTHKFKLEQAQEALRTALSKNSMKVAFKPW